jgi:hypothetical protein
MVKRSQIDKCSSQLSLVVTGVQGFGLPRSMLDKKTLVRHHSTKKRLDARSSRFSPPFFFQVFISTDATSVERSCDMVKNRVTMFSVTQIAVRTLHWRML